MNKTILPVIVVLSKDPVPNVRMNVAKILRSSHASIKEKVNSKKKKKKKFFLNINKFFNLKFLIQFNNNNKNNNKIKGNYQENFINFIR